MGDTIFARASGVGKAGVAVFRLSGPQSHTIAKRLISHLVGKRINSREVMQVTLSDPADGSGIDKGLVIFFENPSSFTGEDVVEFHLHGSRAVEAALYDALSTLGARPAQAGEFTLRAMKNAKLDLAQVEALADLIDSETTLQRKQALGQLEGRLSTLATGWREQILAVLAPLEADIDFPDEGDVPAAVAASAGPAIRILKETLTTFLNQSGPARTIRDGVSIAIIGPPNAGKSSLVNALAGSEVAIVSDTPGTTRDIVEVRLDLGGVVTSVADTAGLHGAGHDAIEVEGMRRARAKAAEADLRVAVLDPASEFVSRETIDLLTPGDFLIWSKADIATGAAIPAVNALPNGTPDGVTVLELSAKTRAGIDVFLEQLSAVVADDVSADEPALTRARHVSAVEDAIDALSRAEANIASAPELAAEDARLAARALGTITGAVGVEDILGEIFSSFCIGK